jgi:large subunit ribosomal protein L17
MKHGDKQKKFGRERGQRKAFITGLAANLILRGEITTTPARAKAIKPVVERLVTIGKRQNLVSLRMLLSRLPRGAALKLYYEVAPGYASRPGGYLRIIKSAKIRMRDASPTARIAFVKD